MEHVEFPKISRWSRDIIVTEKIDGTNGQIAIALHDEDQWAGNPPMATFDVDVVSYDVWVGSKNRWIYPGKQRDNHGFAQWVSDNLGDLVHTLGEGRHYGEVWGPGIQRGYGLKEKRFSLFNVTRWRDLPVTGKSLLYRVPILYEGPNVPGVVDKAMFDLELYGSQVSPGFMRPEGIVIYHTAHGHTFKKTFEGDEKGKGQ
jgi:hypothetical protein